MSNKISPKCKICAKTSYPHNNLSQKNCIRLQKENYFTHKSEKKDIFESDT